MKNFMLTTLSVLFAATSFAQTTVETANDLVAGDNVFNNEQATERQTVYWKYTPTQDEVIVASAINNSRLTCFSLGTDKEEIAIEGASYNVIDNTQTLMYTVFPATQGKTIYIAANGYQQMGLNAEIKSSKDAGKGFPAENYGTIVPGEMQLFAPGTNWRTDPIYAKFTPERDGVLKFTAYSNASYIMDEAGVQYEFNFDRTKYISNASVKVTGGRENTIRIFAYTPMYFTTEMVYPEPGSYDMPFSVTDGANAVPKAAGTYWYLAAVDKDGMLNISSDEQLAGGQVSLFSSSYNVTNDRPDAQSSEGSYNLSFAAKAKTTYYIKVVKGETDADQSFNYILDAYKDGDTEDQPIYISDFTQEFSVPAGKTVYYAVSLDANVKKNITVAATSDVVADATQVSVYQYSYSATTGKSSVTTIIDGGYYGSTYKIKWVNGETGDLTFKATLSDLAKGDDSSNPLDAQLGENVIPTDGIKYYLFNATQSGKLEVTLPDGATATFPKSEYSYQGTYETLVNGNVYAIDVTEGNSYRITIEGAKKDQTFNIAYGKWAAGESMSNPIEVTENEYTLGTETSIWLKYTAKTNCILTIDATDIEYDYANKINYCPIENSDAMMSVFSYVDGNSLYTISFGTSESKTFLVQLKLTKAHEGAKIKFTERVPEAGETVSSALELVKDEVLSVPEASYSKPVWVKVTLKEGESKFTADGYFSAYFYKGKENAENDYMGTRFEMDQVSGTEQGSTSATYERTLNLTEADAGDWYFKITSGNAFHFKVEGAGVPTTIKNATAAGFQSEAYYSLNGTKLQTQRNGINIIRMSDGKTIKAVIRK